jgi:hypothetical protein
VDDVSGGALGPASSSPSTAVGLGEVAAWVEVAVGATDRVTSGVCGAGLTLAVAAATSRGEAVGEGAGPAQAAEIPSTTTTATAIEMAVLALCPTRCDASFPMAR